MDPPPELDPQGLEQLAEDWITLWQSELAAMAADPELAEAWAAAVALGAAWWRAQAAGFGRPAQFPPAPFPPAAFPPAPFPPAAFPPGLFPGFGAADGFGSFSPFGAPRPPAAGPAPDGQRDAGDGGDEPDALARRLAELERRLAEIECRKDGGGPDRPGPAPGAVERKRRT